MSQQQNSYVELPRIKRKSNSWEGKVIDYLLNHPSNRSATEFAIEAITAFWLAEALEGQVNQPELQKACWSAIERLEAKLATIRRIGGIEKLLPDYTTVLSPSPSTVNPTTKTNENSREFLNSKPKSFSQSAMPAADYAYANQTYVNYSAIYYLEYN